MYLNHGRFTAALKAINVVPHANKMKIFYFSNEMHRIRVIAMAKSINIANFSVANKSIVYATFMVFIATDYKMAAEAIFVAIALFHPVAIVILYMLPFGVQFAAEALVSIDRIKVHSTLIIVASRLY